MGKHTDISSKLCEIYIFFVCVCVCVCVWGGGGGGGGGGGMISGRLRMNITGAELFLATRR